MFCYCSGRARGQDLPKTVSKIGAKTLFPIHTEHTDLYNQVSKNMILVDEGKKYEMYLEAEPYLTISDFKIVENNFKSLSFKYVKLEKKFNDLIKYSENNSIQTHSISN